MPKGTYVVSFHRREGSAGQAASGAQAAQHEENVAEVKSGRSSGNGAGVLSVLLVVVLAAIALLLLAAHIARGRPSEGGGAGSRRLHDFLEGLCQSDRKSPG